MIRGILRKVCLAALLVWASVAPAIAADGALRGVVRDPLGSPVSGAQVTLRQEGREVKSATSDPDGQFVFDAVAEGRYQVETTAPGFATATTNAVFVGGGSRTSIAVSLQISGLETSVLVTAAATSVQTSQIGASATVLDSATIDGLGNTDLLEPIRAVPGVAVVQSGARGGATSLFVRGGAANFNKVLVDGVPANDIGGAFDLADFATSGVDSVEILRGANSVVYGSDALTSVVNIATRRGTTSTPSARVTVDGGNFATLHQDASVGGTARRLDYFAGFTHFQTDNDVPNNDYTNNTFSTRTGATVGANTHVSGTVRWIDSDSGSPNAFGFYGVADDSRSTKTATYTSINADTQINDRWQATVRFGSSNQEYHYDNPTPTGSPSLYGDYVGKTVTIASADGRSVTGQAILDYGGTYPSPYDATSLRTLVFGQTNYQVVPRLNIAGGVRVEHEKGTSQTQYSASDKTRNNYGGFAEARASLHDLVFVTGGVGIDNNAVFGTEASPRLSVAAYLRKPSSASALGDTKLTFNAGKGIKEPSVSQELSSLFALIPSGSPLSVEPVGPERSRTLDIGVEQGLINGRARVRIAYYDNRYDDLIEYVSKNVLPQLGVPKAVADASGYGAYVNAQSNTSKGVEISGDVVAGPLKVMASYTYADAVVTASLGSGALFPAENPAFPGIQIGQYSPLVGRRPFRRPANSGSLVLQYTREKLQLALAGYFFGKQDDSTFLSDPFYGYSMLLPNQNMDDAYQKFNLNAGYQVHRMVRAFVTVENLFDEEYSAASGFPSLPRAARAGVTLSFGAR